MKQLYNYLRNLIGDIFKLLPMKEAEINGSNNHLQEYIETLLINIKGALKTYPVLANQKQYLYVINTLQYMADNDVELANWRKSILNSTHDIAILCKQFGEENNGE